MEFIESKGFIKGIKDILVIGALHEWMPKNELQRVARCYGIAWTDIVDYAIDEIGVDTGKENISSFFTDKLGERHDYKERRGLI